jgi:hypothetical protein
MKTKNGFEGLGSDANGKLNGVKKCASSLFSDIGCFVTQRSKLVELGLSREEILDINQVTRLIGLLIMMKKAACCPNPVLIEDEVELTVVEFKRFISYEDENPHLALSRPHQSGPWLTTALYVLVEIWKAFFLKEICESFRRHSKIS